MTSICVLSHYQHILRLTAVSGSSRAVKQLQEALKENFMMPNEGTSPLVVCMVVTV